MVRDRPDLEIAGRYFFAHPGTPCYSGWHNLWSRDWVSNELDPWPALGETDGRRSWSNGAFFGPRPDPVRVGDADCVANGEREALDLVPSQEGIPLACFPVEPNPPPPGDPLPVIDVTLRADQLFFAQLSELLYDDPALAAATLSAFLGDTATVTVVANDSSIYPGSLIATTPEYTIVVVSGTTTPQQLALQALYAGGGPNNYGTFATSPIWWDAAEVVHQRLLDAGVDPSVPLVLVGHSYGGAVAAILTGRYKEADNERKIQLLTYGMPKPGDQNLVSILDTVSQVHVVNTGDPVPSLPPSTSALWVLSIAIPGTFVARWVSMRQPNGRLLVDADGMAEESDASTLSLARLYDLARKAIDGDPVPPILPHRIAEYARRLGAAPPGPPPSPIVIIGVS